MTQIATILNEAQQISTHTLTWSVTEFFDNEMYIPKISTHTLTWSVTHSCKDTLSAFPISTHTLTWSVTWEDFDFTLNKLKDFNSHAHVERDSINPKFA